MKNNDKSTKTLRFNLKQSSSKKNNKAINSLYNTNSNSNLDSLIGNKKQSTNSKINFSNVRLPKIKGESNNIITEINKDNIVTTKKSSIDKKSSNNIAYLSNNKSKKLNKDAIRNSSNFKSLKKLSKEFIKAKDDNINQIPENNLNYLKTNNEKYYNKEDRNNKDDNYNNIIKTYRRYTFNEIKSDKSKNNKFSKIEDLDIATINENKLMQIINSENVIKSLDTFAFKTEGVFAYKTINRFDKDFNKTLYSNKNSMNEFFKKYKKHKEYTRKNVIKKETPSFAFIKEIKNIYKVPNPLGLIKKYGQESEINLNYLFTGNTYINTIAKSIIKSENNHVRKLDLEMNSIDSLGIQTFFDTLLSNYATIKNLIKLDLSNNKIGNKGLDYLIKFIDNQSDCHLKDLKLRNINTSDSSVKKLCDIIVNKIEGIYTLDLSKNNLTEISSVKICNVLTSCESLNSLELHENYFNNKSAANLISHVSKSKNLKHFDISWNKIGDNIDIDYLYNSREDIYKNYNFDITRTKFRNYDLKEFSKTMNIKFKDIQLPGILEKNSKNKNNKKKGNTNNKFEEYETIIKFRKNINKINEISPFAVSLGELFLSKKTSLLHLNISNNNINIDDCKHISETVKENHTILGIHVEGNCMEIDSLGFIHPIDKLDRETNYYAANNITYNSLLQKEKNIFLGNSMLKSYVDLHKKIRFINNCWICQGWRETPFVVDLKETSIKTHEINENIKLVDSRNEDSLCEKDVKLYLCFDNYKGFDMNSLNSESNKYIAYRMCPPGDIKYFYIHNDEVVEDNNSKHVEILKEPVVIVR